MILRRRKKLNELKNGRRSKMLLLFLGLSFLFWILIKMSKEYTDVVQFKVDYINLPKGKMLQGEVDGNIDIIITTYGFNFVKYRLGKKNVKVDLKNIRRKKGSLYYQLSKDLLPQIKKQVTSDVEVISIQPDSLFFNLGLSKTKEVLIVPDMNIQYRSGYNLKGSLEVDPKYLTISGPENLIDSIEKIATENMVLTDVYESIETTLPIIKLDKKMRVTFSTDKVKIKGIVEKFTEATLKLPVEIQNLPKGYTISIIPEEVEVLFNIGLSDYNKINQNDFKVVCDYNRTAKDGLNYLIPEVLSKPEMVTEIKIVPNQIEFLLKK
ncbi:MAG: hypothetical protein KJO83_08245 [Bacteroidia bacterium]|nr:hypothetical protein [Bacteroidia bacterium]